jgi:DNA-binding SARP family transcriptional activator
MLDDFVTSLLPAVSLEGRLILHLVHGPAVSDGTGPPLPVPEGCKRLVVFLAMHGGPVDRRYTASSLWPVGNDERAAGNLRSALWRLNRAELGILVSDKRSLGLRPEVLIDVRLIGGWATRLIAGRPTPQDLEVLPQDVDTLDLLSGWYDDWILLERERLRQRLLHALEALSRAHRAAGRCALAVEAALMAVSAEPLRESAQRELIASHLAEGNVSEGRRGYDSYRRRLRREIGVEPHPDLAAMLHNGMNARRLSPAPQVPA